MAFLPALFESQSRIPSLLRRNQFSDLEQLMESLFGQVPALSGNGRSFPIDIEESDDEYIITADLAGVEKKDVNVTLQDRMLTVQISQEQEREAEEKNFICRERTSGTASRVVVLPQAASEESVDANLKDGVLTITVQKEKVQKAKRIEIQ